MWGPSDNWGPWAAGLARSERIARLRSLRTIVQTSRDRARGAHPLAVALLRAESCEPWDLEEALIELDRLPALDRRKLLSSYLRIIALKLPEAA